MQPQELLRELEGAGEKLVLVLVVGFADGTELIERGDEQKWEKLCAAHERGGRAVGVITFAGDTWSIRVLAPYTQLAAGRYLERIAREIVANSKATTGAVN